MNISSINNLAYQEIHRTGSLQKAAGTAHPPALTEDESQMIRKEFSGSRPVTFYEGNGQTKQEMISSKGRYLDTRI